MCVTDFLIGRPCAWHRIQKIWGVPSGNTNLPTLPVAPAPTQAWPTQTSAFLTRAVLSFLGVCVCACVSQQRLALHMLRHPSPFTEQYSLAKASHIAWGTGPPLSHHADECHFVHGRPGGFQGLLCGVLKSVPHSSFHTAGIYRVDSGRGVAGPWVMRFRQCQILLHSTHSIAPPAVCTGPLFPPILFGNFFI